MSNRFLQITFALVIMMNIVLCALLFQTKARTVKESHEQEEVLNKALVFAYESFWKYSPSIVKGILQDYGIPLTNNNEGKLHLFIPFEACDVCLIHQLSIIRKEYLENNGTIVIISSNSIQDIVLSSLGSLDRISCYPYESDHVLDHDRVYNQNVVLFTYNEGEIHKIHIVNSLYSKATSLYLKNINTSDNTF